LHRQARLAIVVAVRLDAADHGSLWRLRLLLRGQTATPSARHRSTGDPGFGNDESTDGGTRVSRYGLRNLVLRTACAAGP